MFCQIYSFLPYTCGTHICMYRASLQMIHNSPYSTWLYNVHILSYTMYGDLLYQSVFYIPYLSMQLSEYSSTPLKMWKQLYHMLPWILTTVRICFIVHCNHIYLSSNLRIKWSNDLQHSIYISNQQINSRSPTIST